LESRSFLFLKFATNLNPTGANATLLQLFFFLLSSVLKNLLAGTGTETKMNYLEPDTAVRVRGVSVNKVDFIKCSKTAKVRL
jgi:hypothetical protein